MDDDAIVPPDRSEAKDRSDAAPEVTTLEERGVDEDGRVIVTVTTREVRKYDPTSTESTEELRVMLAYAMDELRRVAAKLKKLKTAYQALRLAWEKQKAQP